MSPVRAIAEGLFPEPFVFWVKEIKHWLVGTRSAFYSQSGEDIIISKLLPQRKGFFVDVGAFHPKRYSNTYVLYRRGWRGINIEPSPRGVSLFKLFRGRDITIQAGVSEKEEIRTYYRFSHPGMNTFSREQAQEVQKKNWVRFLGTSEVSCLPLSTILETYVPKNTPLDLLTIDVEGLDLLVLHSNDFTRFSPKVIAIEVLDFTPAYPQNNPTYLFLTQRGYVLHAYTGLTLIFTRTS